MKTQAIVLQSVRYADESYMINLYTREAGFITVSSRVTRKSVVRSAYIAPLQLLEINFTKKPSSQVAYINAASTLPGAERIHTNSIKNLCALLIAEILSSLLRDTPADEYIYDFLLNEISSLNNCRKADNFVLAFLIRLTAPLGVAPDVNDFHRGCCFSTNECRFVPAHIASADALTPDATAAAVLIFNHGMHAAQLLNIAHDDRRKAIHRALKYYYANTNLTPNLKTLDIFSC